MKNRDLEQIQFVNSHHTGEIFSDAGGTRKVNTKEIGPAVIAAL